MTSLFTFARSHWLLPKDERERRTASGRDKSSVSIRRRHPPSKGDGERASGCALVCSHADLWATIGTERPPARVLLATADADGERQLTWHWVLKRADKGRTTAFHSFSVVCKRYCCLFVVYAHCCVPRFRCIVLLRLPLLLFLSALRWSWRLRLTATSNDSGGTGWSRIPSRPRSPLPSQVHTQPLTQPLTLVLTLQPIPRLNRQPNRQPTPRPNRQPTPQPNRRPNRRPNPPLFL